jgi:hypothetical protein
MSTRLQRLVNNARGASQADALRIEPLLGPSFAAMSGRHDTPLLHEVQEERDAPTPTASNKPETQAAIIRTGDTTIAAQSSFHVASTEHPRDIPAREPLQTMTSPTPAEHAPSRVLIEEVRGTSVEHGVLQPVLPATVIAAPNTHRPTRAIAEPAPPSPAMAQQAPAIEEHTQTITISIGRVEVRNAPPAPAPSRRPPFKPGVSLDDFLGRGRGDGR